MSETLHENSPGMAHQARTAGRAIRRHWLPAAGLLLLCLAIAAALTAITPRVYQATNTVMVVTGGGTSVGNYVAADNLSMTKAEQYASIGSSPEVASIARESLSGVQVEGVSFALASGTSQIRVNGQATSPEGAVRTADAFAAALQQEVERVESLMASGGEQTEGVNNLVQLIPISSALQPTAPISPNPVRNGLIGLAAGLVLAALYIFIRSLFDRKIRSSEAVEESTGLAVLGTIPADRRLDDHRQVLDTEPARKDKQAWATAEAIRELRTNLTFSNVDSPARSIVVTSSLAGEGKSSIAANLAVAIAATGEPVILIDADLRRSVQSNMFDLPGNAGLTDLLSGAVQLDDVLQRWNPDASLFLLSAGRTPPNPSELLGSRTMKRLLAELTRDYIVVIDSPPLLPVTDASVLARNVDGLIVVAQANRTNLDDLGKAVQRLRKVDATVLGVVLNRVPRKGSSAGQYGYYSDAYYYSSDTGTKKKRSGRTSERRRAQTAAADS